MGSPEIEEIYCIVSGKVQGVFFRNFVDKHARELALVGYTKNMPDSTVEVVAQGDRAKLEELIGHLRKGPFLARVTGVEVEWRQPSGVFKSFDIVF